MHTPTAPLSSFRSENPQALDYSIMDVLEAELLALHSIYESCLQVSDQPDCKLVVYDAPPLKLQFYIAADYPDAKPAHVLKQQGVPSTVLKNISQGGWFYEPGFTVAGVNREGLYMCVLVCRSGPTVRRAARLGMSVPSY